MDPGIRALAYGTLGSVAAPALYSTYDWMDGQTGPGEQTLNSLIALLAPAGAVAGGAILAATDPAARAVAAAHAAASSHMAGRPLSLEALSRLKADMEAAAQRAQQANPGMGRHEAVARAGRLGGRRLMGGTLAGALAGGIPAIMMMRDQPAEQGAV